MAPSACYPCPLGRHRRCQAPTSPRYCATTSRCPPRASTVCISTAMCPSCRSSGQLCAFLCDHLGNRIASPAAIRPLHDRFVQAVASFADQQVVPVVQFERGQRKDDVAATLSGALSGRVRAWCSSALPRNASSRSKRTKHIVPPHAVHFRVLAAVGRGQPLLLLSAGWGVGTGLHQGRHATCPTRCGSASTATSGSSSSRARRPSRSTAWTTASCAAPILSGCRQLRLPRPGRRAGLLRPLARLPALAADTDRSCAGYGIA